MKKKKLIAYTCNYGSCNNANGILSRIIYARKGEKTNEEVEKRHIKEEHPRIYKKLYKEYEKETNN